jgi:hypothetical protein
MSSVTACRIRHVNSSRTAGLVLLVVLSGAPPAHAATCDTPIDILLKRSAAYVAELSEELSGIAFDEVVDISSIETVPRPGGGARRSRVRSDLLLAMPAGADHYLELRDVRQIGDRQLWVGAERLTALFEGGPADLLQRIIGESARFLPASRLRQHYSPMLPLAVLTPARQHRFRFSIPTDRMPPAALPLADRPRPQAGAFRVTADLCVLAYRETPQVGMVRPVPPATARDSVLDEVEASGRIWVEARSGAVIIGELLLRGSNAGDRDASADILVSYTSEPLLGFLVPVEMREQVREGRARWTTRTTYDRPRKFRARPEAWLTPVDR